MTTRLESSGANAGAALQTALTKISDRPVPLLTQTFYEAPVGEPVAFEIEVPYSQIGVRYVQVSYAPDVAPDGTVRQPILNASGGSCAQAVENTFRQCQIAAETGVQHELQRSLLRKFRRRGRGWLRWHRARRCRER